jgi:hypothetical protein
MTKFEDFAAGLTETEMHRAMEEAGDIVKDLERGGLPTVAGLAPALVALIDETSQSQADFEKGVATAARFLKIHAENGFAVAEKTRAKAH